MAHRCAQWLALNGIFYLAAMTVSGVSHFVSLYSLCPCVSLADVGHSCGQAGIGLRAEQD